MTTTLEPVYGRDYKSAKEAIAAYNEGKDFVVSSIEHPYCGAYCSKRDFGDKQVKLRYNKLRDAVFAN